MRSRFSTALFLLAAAASPIASGADVDLRVIVSGEIAPGVYGRVDFGSAPPAAPVLLYAQPVIVKPVAGPRPAPWYLHVPPGHAKKWDKHCHRYNACGRPVYFVKSAEYEPGHKGKGKKDK